MPWMGVSGLFVSVRTGRMMDRMEKIRDVGDELTPMQNAPPKSESATHGQGSLVWSMFDMWI